MKHMTRLLLLVLLPTMFAAAGSALAADTPTIRTPSEGTALGPNYDTSGSMPYKAFLVVMTDCVRTDTGGILRSVPGLRHWTDSDGQFAFRCARPRVAWGELAVPLEYRVRCFENSSGGEHGPEAVVRCRQAQ